MRNKNVFDWYVSNKRDFELGTAPDETNHSDCVYFKSIVLRPKTYGYICKTIDAQPFLGRRIEMSARNIVSTVKMV